MCPPAMIALPGAMTMGTTFAFAGGAAAATGAAAASAGLFSGSFFNTLSTIGRIGQTVLSFVSARQQAQAEQDQLNYQAAVERNNRIISDRKAQDLEEIKQRQMNQQKLRGEMLKGRQLVTMAGQGGDVTEGSNVDLLADAAELSKYEELIIGSNYDRQIAEERNRGQNISAQADLLSTQAANVNTSGAGELLSGFGNFSSKWYEDRESRGPSLISSPRTTSLSSSTPSSSSPWWRRNSSGMEGIY